MKRREKEGKGRRKKERKALKRKGEIF